MEDALVECLYVNPGHLQGEQGRRKVNGAMSTATAEGSSMPGAQGDGLILVHDYFFRGPLMSVLPRTVPLPVQS